VDRSWSMQTSVEYDGKDDMTRWRGETKVDVARRELIQAITGLGDGASFNVIAFGFTTKPFSQKLVEATDDNRKRARTWVEKLELDGSTNLGGTLLEAFDSLQPSARPRDTEIADTIVVMTDGVPNCGPIGEADDVLQEIRRLNRDHRVVIHCVYLGNEGDVKFLTALAAENGGQFVHHRK
jgi:Mg-chelatase subunit ChlD